MPTGSTPSAGARSGATGPAGTSCPVAAPAETSGPTGVRRLRYHEFRGDTLARGVSRGAHIGSDTVHLDAPNEVREVITGPGGDPVRYETASWIGPLVQPGFTFTELVASWQADTPGGSVLELAVQVSTAGGEDPGAPWYPLAWWSGHDGSVRPASVPFADETGRTSTDAFVARRANLTGYRLRATLLRPVGASDLPALTSVGMIASCGPAMAGADRGPGPLCAAGGRILAVPASSQREYTGQYPHWDGGGDAWCSPISTSMVLRYWGTGPQPGDYDWVCADYPDGFIHHAVRHCFDYSFTGAGNWAFNTAYAARYGLSTFVTRLRDLTEAELFIDAGIPLVASIRFEPGALRGADYTTNGHLLVVVGFTREGDVVVNDPAAPGRATVRRTYDRHEFATAWLAGSGGAVYVMRPPELPLPPTPAEPNW